MGFDTALFVQQPVDGNVLCNICYDVMDDPSNACGNFHAFCRDCLAQWSQNPHNRKCPECRDDLQTPAALNRPLKGVILGLQVRCPEQQQHEEPPKKRTRRGAKRQTPTTTPSQTATRCPWQGTLDHYLQFHCHECTMVQSDNCPDCNDKVPAGMISRHQRQATCKHCHAHMCPGLLLRHQKHACPRRIMPCRLCQASVRRHELETHRLHACSFRNVKCEACGEYASACDLAMHQQNATCEQCQQRMCPGLLLDHTANQCPNRMVQCPNCQHSMRAVDYQNHPTNSLACMARRVTHRFTSWGWTRSSSSK